MQYLLNLFDGKSKESKRRWLQASIIDVFKPWSRNEGPAKNRFLREWIGGFNKKKKKYSKFVVSVSYGLYFSQYTSLNSTSPSLKENTFNLLDKHNTLPSMVK